MGLAYFGARYLVQRIGRWATPDPLSVHAAGGGEALNAYHYVSGNLLQARDPLGLCADNSSCSTESGPVSSAEEAFTSPDGYPNPSDNPEKAVLDAHRAATMPNKLVGGVASKVDDVGLKPAVAGEALAVLSANAKVFAFSLFATEVHDHESATQAAGQLVAGALAGKAVSSGLELLGGGATRSGPSLGSFADDLAAPKLGGAARGTSAAGQTAVRAVDDIPATFIGQANGPSIVVPRGATGPVPTTNGLGVQYVGGAGGPGLSPKVSSVRIMEPTLPAGPSPGYPRGYASYSNAAKQTINAVTGQTVAKSSPWWHIDLGGN